MLLYEFDETVVRHTLGVASESDDSVDDALVDALLEGARIAVKRLSKGGDQTSRVLGGGVENRWRTRLANVQEFLKSNRKLGGMAATLLNVAGVAEEEMRQIV